MKSNKAGHQGPAIIPVIDSIFRHGKAYVISHDPKSIILTGNTRQQKTREDIKEESAHNSRGLEGK
jgi:hypothetical protein